MASGPITSWQIEREKVEAVKFSFLGLQNHCDSDCNHELKRHMLLGRKAMTSLDSVFKSRHITLSKKFHLVKAMVFPVVVYGYVSWTIKKAEWWRTDAFKFWCWRRLLRVSWTARSNQSVLKEINPEYSLEWLMLKLKLQTSAMWCDEPTHWKWPRCWERFKTKGEGDGRVWDDWVASMTQWTWIWPNFGR